MQYIERLRHSLQWAIDKRIISGWTVEGSNVVIQKGSVSLPVPVLEASGYLIGLFMELEHDFMELEHDEVKKTVLASAH